jgi:thiamine pyrophosphokinase
MSSNSAPMVVVVCGGPAPHPKSIEFVPADAVVIAVDSGLDNARDLGLRPIMVIGDLDSISPSGLDWVRKQSIEIKEFPKDKDKSDLELALNEASNLGDSVFVIASDSGRFDQTFGNITLMGSESLALVKCHGLIGAAYVTLIRDREAIYGSNGKVVSIFCLGRSASGVTARGFDWELTNDKLPSGSTLGLSNVLKGEEGMISVTDGVLVAIQPEAIQV